jgi:hypothetical protein
MTAALHLGWSSTATDTQELNMSSARFAAAETAFIPLAVAFAAPPPRPEPAPVRLPKRLRRRAASHLALLATSAAGFATAIAAAGAL